MRRNTTFRLIRVKLRGCHTICPPKGVETKLLQDRHRKNSSALRGNIRHFARFVSNCEAVIQYALLRGSNLSPSNIAFAKNPSALRGKIRHFTRFVSNCEAVIQYALLGGSKLSLSNLAPAKSPPLYEAKCIISFKSLQTARLSYNMPS